MLVEWRENGKQEFVLGKKMQIDDNGVIHGIGMIS